MTDDGTILIGKSTKSEVLMLRLANRHGLITGATGTGKTVTLQVLAEGFSAAGVPVFMADVKGDLAGISQKGEDKPFLAERAAKLDLANYSHAAFPAVFWDLAGERGSPIRARARAADRLCTPTMPPCASRNRAQSARPEYGSRYSRRKW